MSNLINAIEREQMTGKRIPVFKAGDTVVVKVNVIEGNRQRIQAYEGIVIAKRNRGMNSAFTVRKISHGEGVERVFMTYSNAIDSIEVKRRGDVRRAKLYYLRERSGKSARIREEIRKKSYYDNVIEVEAPAKAAPAEKAPAKEEVKAAENKTEAPKTAPEQPATKEQDKSTDES